MPEQELRDKVSQHHTILFGAEGQGGLVREVEVMKKAVATHEGRLNSMSYRWLGLVLLVGILGNALGQRLVSLVTALKFLAP